MGRGLKIGLGVVGVVVIFIVGLFVYVYSNLDSLVKTAVEEYGPKYTGVAVKLDSVELSPESGEGRMSGLLVGNPPGYATDAAFRLGSIALSIDMASLTSDTIVIRSIIIDAPDVTYEFGDGGSNIETIGRNVERAAGGSSSGAQATGQDAGTPAGDADSGKKMVIESLTIANGRVSVSHPLLQGEKLGTPLPTIQMKDIGKDGQGGATPAQVVDLIMDAMEKQVAGAVGSLDIKKMAEGLSKDAEDTLRKAIEGAGDGGLKGVEDAARGAGESIRNLLGR